MKRLLLVLSLVVPSFGQAPAAPPPPEAAVAAEQNVHGTIDFGYRWHGDVGGNFDTYRSVVNLGGGPKLFGFDFTVDRAPKRLFDRLDVHGMGWGGDPYNTTRVRARREGSYDLGVDYRNFDYFSFLPSFANPAAQLGGLLNQRSIDSQRRNTNVTLDLRPGKMLMPFFAYMRDSGTGTGLTNFVSDANEYTAGNALRDSTNHYRGGLRLEADRLHWTLEQGGTTFKDDQYVFDAGRDPGNRLTPVFGQRLFLQNARQAYGVRGDSVYTRSVFSAAPASWLDFQAQFLFSQPAVQTNFTQAAEGNIFYFGTAGFYARQRDLYATSARQPHSSGGFSLEVRPFSGLRIIESWFTDRFHNASSALLVEQVLESTATGLRTTGAASDRLAVNYSQQQVDAIFDLGKRLTLRAGHRYQWGDGLVRAPLASQLGIFESADLKRHVALAGLTVRPFQKLSANIDVEVSPGDQTYFRTSIQNYQRFRSRAQYRTGDFTFGAQFAYLNNDNGARTIQYSFLSRSNTLSLAWTPQGGRKPRIFADYSRSTLRSDILYIVPQTQERERSFYRDNLHAISGLVEIPLPVQGSHVPALAFGGAFVMSSGSRPADYWQPLARFSIPLAKRVQWYSEWRWWALSQSTYRYEGFRAHQFTAGLKLTM